MMDMWYLKTAAETAKLLNTDADLGLTAGEHEKRAGFHGKNTLKTKKNHSAVGVFLRQFTDYMVMILMAAAVVSAYLGEIADAVMIAVIILLNGILGFIQEYRAERSLAALEKLTEDEAKVVIGGEVRVIKAEDLVVGDVVLLEAGTKVPADLRIVRSFHLRAEEATLTGEGKDVLKTAAAAAGEVPLAKRTGMCYNGTVITGGRGRGIVVATGMDTELGRIVGMMNKTEQEYTPLQKQLKHLGKVLVILCAVVCLLVAGCGILLGGDRYEMILTGLSLGIASIPEGLPVVVTVCLALGVRRLTAANAIVRRLASVETLGSVTCICTDKTGTLTENRMRTAYYRWGDQEYEPENPAARGSWGRDIALIIANCHSLYCDKGEFRGDATEVALMRTLPGNVLSALRLPVEDEQAFDSERKMMSVFVRENRGTCVLAKGAPNRILAKCAYYRRENGDYPLDGATANRLLNEAAVAGKKGFRVLGLALKRGTAEEAYREENLTFLGFAALADPLRPDAHDALRQARKAGIRSIMITGDQPGTALAVARSLELCKDDDEVVTGERLGSWDDRELDHRLPHLAVVALASPADKKRIVDGLRRQGDICAMTGDGVNDAPALKAADIGIAMGKKGTDVTREAADFVLADDRFATIVEAIFQGRGIYDNIRKFICYLLASNIGEIMVMLFSVLLLFPLPLLPMQILWLNLITDGLPAMALAMDPPDRELMARKPAVAKSIFADGVGKRIIIRGCLIGIVCFGSYLTGLACSGELAVAQTMAFQSLILCQLFYAFECRRGEKTTWSSVLFGNGFLLITFIVSCGLQLLVVYHPFCQYFLNTVSLSPKEWGISVIFAAIPSVCAILMFKFFQKIKK